MEHNTSAHITSDKRMQGSPSCPAQLCRHSPCNTLDTMQQTGPQAHLPNGGMRMWRTSAALLAPPRMRSPKSLLHVAPPPAPQTPAPAAEPSVFNSAFSPSLPHPLTPNHTHMLRRP